MAILLGLVLACVLLYFWLTGHWFARALMFLLLVVVLGGIGAGITGSAPGAGSSGGIPGAIIGAILAWPVSGIPFYVLRHHFEKATGRKMVGMTRYY